MSENRLPVKSRLTILIIIIIIYLTYIYLSNLKRQEEVLYTSSEYTPLFSSSISLFENKFIPNNKYQLLKDYKIFQSDKLKSLLTENQLLTFLKCYYLIFFREESESYSIISDGLDMIKDNKIEFNTVNISWIFVYNGELLDNFLNGNFNKFKKHFAKFLLIEIDKENNVKLNIEGLNIRDPFYDKLSELIDVKNFTFLSSPEIEAMFKKQLKDGRYKYSYMDIALRIWYYYYLNLLAMFDKPENFVNPKKSK